MRKKGASAEFPSVRGPKANAGTEKTLVHRIRAFQWSIQANRKCADCSERGPTYICLNFQTFVCQTCSGIHRSFGHKIKGITLSDWSLKELEDLEAGGNERAQQAWLATWSSAKHPAPDSNNAEEVKEWIRLKYVVKSWWHEPRAQEPGAVEAQVTRKTTSDDLISTSAGTLHSCSLHLLPVSAPACAVEADSQASWKADFFSSAAPPVPALEAAPLATPVVEPAPTPVMGLLDLEPCPPPFAAPALSPPGPFSVPEFAGMSGFAEDLCGLNVGEPQVVAAPAARKDAGSFGGGIMHGLDSLDFSGSLPPAFQSPFPGSHGTLDSPLMEPAEEPAPVEVGSLGDRLREAVLNSNGENLKQLFQQCLEPAKKIAPAPNERFAAFAAFDELRNTSAKQPQAQVDFGSQHLFGAQPCARSLPIPCGATLDPFAFPGGDCGWPQLPPQPQRPAQPTAALGGGLALAAQPAGLSALDGLQWEQPTPPRQCSGMVDTDQLQHMDQQELVQMQLMISRAMQARTQLQCSSPAIAPAPLTQPAELGFWQLDPAAGAKPSIGPPPVMGDAPPAPQLQVQGRTPSPPKEFGDLLGAFHARNPISGLDSFDMLA